MKRTLACFLAALAMLTVAVALPQRAEPETMTTALDLTDVEEVRVVSQKSLDIVISHDPATVRWPSFGDGTVALHRDGAVLVVESTHRLGYPSTVITLPPRIHRLTVDEASVHAEVPVPEMLVTTSRSLSWNGEGGRLEIVDAAAEDCDEFERDPVHCRGTITIDAKLEELVVTSLDSDVVINGPGSIAQATLRLAPRANFGLTDARSAANIRIEEVDADGNPLDTTQIVPVIDDAEAAAAIPVPTDND